MLRDWAVDSLSSLTPVALQDRTHLSSLRLHLIFADPPDTAPGMGGGWWGVEGLLLCSSSNLTIALGRFFARIYPLGPISRLVVSRASFVI